MAEILLPRGPSDTSSPAASRQIRDAKAPAADTHLLLAKDPELDERQLRIAAPAETTSIIEFAQQLLMPRGRRSRPLARHSSGVYDNERESDSQAIGPRRPSR
jgi:hypothetical protein